jgi:outer membrane protein OmpA-like peptidoglycan-associated protein
MTGAVQAQEKQTIRGAAYVPTIWVDPDGCEHWVMDDGAEGYMTPNVNRQGIPVCRKGSLCGELQSDQFFSSGSSTINKNGRARLAKFFKEAGARAYIVTGHTDSRASDEYNMGLSFRRATAVAKIGAAAGANIVDVRGYGERMPIATNKTAKGRAENRRVEIMCMR